MPHSGVDTLEMELFILGEDRVNRVKRATGAACSLFGGQVLTDNPWPHGAPLRINRNNPNHHLWHNNGTWFLAYMVYPTPHTKERRRFSLKTRCVETARRRRDEIFASIKAVAFSSGTPRAKSGQINTGS